MTPEDIETFRQIVSEEIRRAAAPNMVVAALALLPTYLPPRQLPMPEYRYQPLYPGGPEVHTYASSRELI